MNSLKKLIYSMLCVGLITVSVGVQPVYAASITVNETADSANNSNSQCSLREAIIAANTNTAVDGCPAGTDASGDMITLANTTYSLTVAATSEDASVDGDLDIINNTAATDLIIVGNGATIQQTTADRVFHILLGATVQIQNLTITGGNSVATGGGISNGGTLTVIDSTFSNNSAGNGGAIYSGPNGFIVTNSIFTDNSAMVGGAIFQSQGTSTITDSTFYENFTTSSGTGGAIANDNGATLTLTNSTLNENTATASAGGISNTTTSTLNVMNSTISGNTTSSVNGRGGGIFNDSTSTVNLTDSTISNNTADYGGGVSNSGILHILNSTFSGNNANVTGSSSGGGIYSDVAATGPVTVTNSTFYNNSATGSGGGIYHYIFGSSSLVLRNSTLSNNSAGNEGGGLVLLPSTGASFYNSIIANSTSGNDCVNHASTTTFVNTLIEDGTCSPTFTGDPNLGSLANNGGPTQTMALNTGSTLAIDAGDPATCEAKDQRGVSRPQGAGCDIGAFEVDNTFPTVVSDSLVASYASGAGPNNFTVTFSENVYDPSGDTNSNDVTFIDNYLLVEDGVNGIFDTTSCEGGLEPDDVQVAIPGVTYNSSLYTATVNLSGVVPDGSYRLFVCGTTSIIDPAVNELNDGISDYTFDFTVGGAATTPSSGGSSSLPATGFTPQRVTSLPSQPINLSYTMMGDVWLEIPELKVKTNIVGVPQSEDKTWDVKWLGNNTGWLNGTAFPSWEGNSVLTGHVYGADGLPGPFVKLQDLNYGDQVIVHMYGQKYIFEIYSIRLVRPGINAYAFQHLEDASYLTLITCQGYDEQTDSYRFRRIVRSVLVDVQNE